MDTKVRKGCVALGIAAVGFLVAAAQMRALDNGLARTPPMGWNSWNKFACNVSEDLIRQAADAMVSSGMRDAGYQYIVIDDCWQVDRDAQGNIVADAQHFPSGMKALADYVHAKGLKFGIYSDAGTGTCQNRPGGRGYEFQDARQYAAWGVDYLKYDWCNHSTQDSAASYSIMRDALKKSGRPIVFSLCEWGSTKPWLWAGDIGNLWRSTGDITDKWDTGEKQDGLGLVQILDLQDGLQSYAGPGHWNDPDMLEVGNGKLTLDENRVHMGMWAMLAAPLLAGNNLSQLTPEITAVLTNREVIAIDQDPLGKQAERIFAEGPIEIWSRPLADGGRALAIFNFGEDESFLRGIPLHLKEAGAGSGWKARDIWAAKDLGPIGDDYKFTLKRHASLLLRLSH